MLYDTSSEQLVVATSKSRDDALAAVWRPGDEPVSAAAAATCVRSSTAEQVEAIPHDAAAVRRRHLAGHRRPRPRPCTRPRCTSSSKCSLKSLNSITGPFSA